jgi:hypothetical protein
MNNNKIQLWPKIGICVIASTHSTTVNPFFSAIYCSFHWSFRTCQFIDSAILIIQCACLGDIRSPMEEWVTGPGVIQQIPHRQSLPGFEVHIESVASLMENGNNVNPTNQEQLQRQSSTSSGNVFTFTNLMGVVSMEKCKGH